MEGRLWEQEGREAQGEMGLEEGGEAAAAAAAAALRGPGRARCALL